MRILILFLIGATLFAGDDVPTWVREAAAQPQGTPGAKIAAQVLLQEEAMQVGEDGKVLHTFRKVVRVLNNEGRDYARGSLIYLDKTEKVRDLRGWLLPKSGEPKRLGKNDVIDMALVDNDIYNEVRHRMVTAALQASPGDVFAFEGQLERKSVFTQTSYEFQGRLPTFLSRFSLTLPAGWEYDAKMLNHPDLKPQGTSGSYVWELRNLPEVADEPLSPQDHAVVARLAVSYFKPKDSSVDYGVYLRSWSEVAKWLAELSDPQAAVTAEISAKARELTASATDEVARVTALAKYAQSIRYVSIQTGIGRGGGYRPHVAQDVLSKAYGDCKDKANLLRALLKAINIESYPVSIYSGDARYVREEWPSPQQFNHAILAIRVSDQFQAPAVLAHPRLGRLLFFDPTDPNTPLGFLPEDEQHAFALVNAGERGELVRTPLAPAQANLLTRKVKAEITPMGDVKVNVVEQGVGEPAFQNRGLYTASSKDAYRKVIERWVTRGVAGASISRLDVQDADGKTFTLDFDFQARTYGQILQNRLLAFKTAFLERSQYYTFPEKERRYPVVIHPSALAEEAEIQIPAGFAVDEMPENVTLETSFGKYSATWLEDNGRILFRRQLHLQGSVVPPSNYAEVQRFFNTIVGAETEPVVLIKK